MMLNCFLSDRNECDEHAGELCANGQCVNLDGTFECACDEGYAPSANGKSCAGTYLSFIHLDLCSFICHRLFTILVNNLEILFSKHVSRISFILNSSRQSFDFFCKVGNGLKHGHSSFRRE